MTSCAACLVAVSLIPTTALDLDTAPPSSPDWVMSTSSHRTAGWRRWKSGSWTSSCCPQTRTCGTCCVLLLPAPAPPPLVASSSCGGCGAPWRSWSLALTFPKTIRRRGRPGRCTRRFQLLLLLQPRWPNTKTQLSRRPETAHFFLPCPSFLTLRS